MGLTSNDGSYSHWLMFNRHRPLSGLGKRRDGHKLKKIMIESIISNLEYYSFPRRLEKLIKKQDYAFINNLYNKKDNPESFYDLLEGLL